MGTDFCFFIFNIRNRPAKAMRMPSLLFYEQKKVMRKASSEVYPMTS